MKNKSVYLVTVKPKVFAIEILKYFGLYSYFSNVYGSDLSNINDKKEILIRKLLTKENVSASNTIMIGDREFNIRGAQHKGIRAIGVTYVYGSAEELAASGPDFIVNAVSELSELLNK